MWAEFEVNGGFGGEDRREFDADARGEERGCEAVLRSFHSFPRVGGDNVEVLIALTPR